MSSFNVTKENCSFLVDLYELTMAAAYWSNGVTGTAAFELYFRRLPEHRSFIVAAGLEQALDFLCNLHFTEDQAVWLQRHPAFHGVDPRFFDYLRNFRFSCDVWAVPEGTPLFPLEPLIQVRGPLIEAQIVETYLLTMFNMQSMVATKSARIVASAAGKGVVDFGSRRAHGPQAGLLAARAAYIGGCIGTSNVLAGKIGGIPIYGTAAHSFTMAFASELEAFLAYSRTFPQNTTLLIDTYDVLRAAHKVKDVPSVKAVRIDSGDLVELSRNVREILDRDQLQNVQIMVSGDLNEYKIEKLIQAKASIDLFGVGTDLVTSHDAPAINLVYKMVSATIKGKEVSTIKTSPGKPSYPGRKQIYRHSKNGLFSHDEICSFDEHPSGEGVPLLKQYLQAGHRMQEPSSLSEIRDHTKGQLKQLKPTFQWLSGGEEYPVRFSNRLEEELDRMKNRTL
jgi:nicotinate phosphoribosyltransferase